MINSFEGGVANWQEKLGLVRDAVRQELVAQQLAAHLPEASLRIRVLDVGCGQGTQALRLADSGYDVTGIDPSEALLSQARQAADQRPSGVREHLRFVHGDLDDASKTAGKEFDVVCCHGVLMYLPELEPAIHQLSALVSTGGLLSVLTRNRASIAMRAGMTKDWQGALDGFDARHYRNRLGVEEVRADEPEEVIAALKADNANVVAWYGVRLFTDHWSDEPLPDDFDKLVEAEAEAGRRDPYRRLTSLTHVVARKTAQLPSHAEAIAMVEE